jgi:exosortase
MEIQSPAYERHASGPSARRGAPRFDYGPLRSRFTLPRPALWAFLALLPLLAILFGWTFKEMYLRWTATGGYYSHGPLIIPISLVCAWLIIRRRGLPMHSTVRSRQIGLVLIIGALLVHLACMFGLITVISGFMLIPLLAGIVLYLGGTPMLSRLWFPIVFLAFMVPLPDITIYSINFHLKIYAASASAWLVNALGIPVFRAGSEIYMQGHKTLTVEDACSGLRSLISLLAFATLFAYACRLRGYKRLLLFLSAVPIALAANVVRITVLIIVANAYTTALCQPGGSVHDSMGILVFVFAFGFMFIEEGILDLLPNGRRRPPASPEAPASTGLPPDDAPPHTAPPTAPLETAP